jgi:uncharacterized membrane protein
MSGIRIRARGSFGTTILYAAGAVLLGVLVPRLEARYLPGLATGGTAPALALLSAIAAGTLPLTGLVFSLAFVMVQFSTTAYSPRLVGWLVGSSSMNHTLGAFTAAFLYSLAALAWVDRGGSGKVPLLTVAVAILLLLVSVVHFVMLVDRLAMLQIARVLAYVGDQGRAVIETAYRILDPGELPDGERAPEAQGLPAGGQWVVYRGPPVVVQAVDVRRIVALAARDDAVIAIAAAVGDTLIDGMPLLRVHGAARSLREDRLRDCFRLGGERTFEQDPKYAIRLLVDIAIRALSPAVNDPTTAVQALDQLEDLLVRLGRCRLSAGSASDARGGLRLVYPVPPWEDFVLLAFDEIRFYGASSIQVTRRMRALLRNLMAQTPVQRHVALQRYLDRINNGVARAFEDVDDRHDALAEDRQGLGLSRGPAAS